jgi:hypothetical protein
MVSMPSKSPNRMPAPRATPPSHAPRTLRTLIVLTALVLLAHALVLGGLPSVSLFAGRAQEPPAPLVRFVTRTIPAPAVVEPPQIRPIPVPKAARKIQPEAVPSTNPEPAFPGPSPEAAPPGDAAATATVAVESVPETQTQAPAPSSDTPPAAAPPAPEARRVQKLAYAQPARLVYDGRGEERGFVKYAANAELLWLPEGAQYSARLEISAWGFRLRTWTSKGALGEAGLLPARFGDKPRGAELATHFQRDKGIISFSANNPDVPLLEGAQDKLSALLQLSAMVAGEPERYSQGTVVSFQAADAHRAELWDFKVGALEPLELPGGTLNSLKLSKEPTLEFDQRIEVWLAPEAHYLPVRLRITEANGAFADLLWRNTQKPD